jgi:hypothetical protein
MQSHERQPSGGNTSWVQRIEFLRRHNARCGTRVAANQPAASVALGVQRVLSLGREPGHLPAVKVVVAGAVVGRHLAVHLYGVQQQLRVLD